MIDRVLGENLIFLVSQPRAGSTLLQRILGAHPTVFTASESWFMLDPLYALRAEGHQADYDALVAQRALKEFLQYLPDGEQAYFEGARRMYTYLYQRALVSSGRLYFLDKTPRYYLVLSELRRVFPAAHYIVLLRNPLAVLSSVLDTWVKEKWTALYRFRQDLVLAPRLLTECIRAFDQAAIVVHYEHLLAAPEQETRKICEAIGLEFKPEMVKYGRSDQPAWSLGDRQNVSLFTRPVARYSEKWKTTLNDPQVWRLAHDYLELLGEDLLSTMGYSGPELRGILADTRPALAGLTVSFSWLTNRAADQRTPLERQLIRVMRFFHRRSKRQNPII